uniref:E3 ubiquitin-protein ligase n=1 Tax=Callorhinchus milii TaxID=7868 RepID=A0A4W3K9P9_CALMI
PPTLLLSAPSATPLPLSQPPSSPSHPSLPPSSPPLPTLPPTPTPPRKLECWEWSGAGGSSAGASNSDLASLCEYLMCIDYVLPPILQCQSGHLVCSNCGTKLTCSSTCRGPLGSIRNLAMEKVVNFVLFPGKYFSSGCEITLPHTEKADHEQLCEFRPYSCLCPGGSCKWQGSLDAVTPHLMHQHKSMMTLQGEDIVFMATDINLTGASDRVMMPSSFSFHFMLLLEKQGKYDGHQQFFAKVQLIVTRKQAENFSHRLEFNGHRRRLTWEATP